MSTEIDYRPYPGLESRTTLYAHDELRWPTAARTDETSENLKIRRWSLWQDRAARLFCMIGAIGNAMVGVHFMNVTDLPAAELPYVHALASVAMMVSGGGFTALVFALTEKAQSR